MRKYCTTRTDSAFAKSLHGVKPEEISSVQLKNQKETWNLLLYYANMSWAKYTKARGAIMFVPERANNIIGSNVLTFDLFYYSEDILKFWKDHKDGFKAIDILPENFPKLHEASKILDLNGEAKVSLEHPSAWAETYAASLFYDRGWATHDEVNDAVKHAHWLRMFLNAVDEGDAVWYPPEEGDVEINCRFSFPDGEVL